MSRYIHKQLASECELVAALNARILLGLETAAYNIHSDAHKLLVKQFGMGIDPYPLFSEGYGRLGLQTRDILPTEAGIIENITDDSCVIGTLYGSTTGWHAICIAEKRGNSVLVLNISSLPLLHDKEGWTDVSELMRCLRSGPQPSNDLLHWKVVTKKLY